MSQRLSRHEKRFFLERNSGEDTFSEAGRLRNLEGCMDLEERLDLACRGTVEVIQRPELRELLATKQKPRAYWGFECSGKRDTARPD